MTLRAKFRRKPNFYICLETEKLRSKFFLRNKIKKELKQSLVDYSLKLTYSTYVRLHWQWGSDKQKHLNSKLLLVLYSNGSVFKNTYPLFTILHLFSFISHSLKGGYRHTICSATLKISLVTSQNAIFCVMIENFLSTRHRVPYRA